ncbi:hypothetical protein [Nonomuraea roseoviolacea]|uniref:hypothetical protein n=1 Tax=Nonomuraea roseoviolacea TaxID=103837 RepID=UPI0031D70269
MYRVASDDLPHWGELLDRWSVEIDETGRGDWVARSKDEDQPPVVITHRVLEILRQKVEEYEVESREAAQWTS